jgi:hypothetical protein
MKATSEQEQVPRARGRRFQPMELHNSAPMPAGLRVSAASTCSTKGELAAFEFGSCRGPRRRWHLLPDRQSTTIGSQRAMLPVRRASSTGARANGRMMAADRLRLRAARRNLHRERRESCCAVVQNQGSERLQPIQAQSPSRASRRLHASVALGRAAAKGCCQPIVLAGRGQRKLPLPDSLRCEVQGLWNVLPLKIRIQIQNLIGGHSVCHHVQDDRNWNTQPTNTWDSAHLIGSNGNAWESRKHRVTSVYRGSGICRAHEMGPGCASAARNVSA